MTKKKIPDTELIVLHNDKEIMMLNRKLLDNQDCWKNLKALKHTHKVRLELSDLMEEEEDKGILQTYDRIYTQLEFRLQDLWGFPRDSKFHRFWYRPKCKCPHMDNNDAYPTGYYVIQGDCPLHWMGT